MNILVTGGAGYIGSHTVRSLQRNGFNVVVLDNLDNGHRSIVETVLDVPLVVGNVGDRILVDSLLSGTHPVSNGQPISAIIHFAAYTYVGESVTNPEKYYRNNVGESIQMLETMLNSARRQHSPVIPIVFSSTCSTYGLPENLPITETAPQKPINPYGMSKFMVERILSDFGMAYGVPSVIFRYFNAAGADPSGDLGENHSPETHLIPLVLDAIMDSRKELNVYGNDYPTDDGTCIRDYVHVCDLADAHVLGLKSILNQPQRSDRTKSRVYNLGNGTGHSVQQVIDTARLVTGHDLQVKISDRRLGDPPVLIALADKAFKELGWKPRFQKLETIIEHAWRWHVRCFSSTN